MAKRTRKLPTETLADSAQNAALAEGTHGDPFAFLGVHGRAEGDWVVRVFRPGAESAELLPDNGAPLPLAAAGDDLFVAVLDHDPGAYRLRFGANGTA